MPITVICHTMMALRVAERPRTNMTVATDIAAADRTIMASRKIAPASEFDGCVAVSYTNTPDTTHKASVWSVTIATMTDTAKGLGFTATKEFTQIPLTLLANRENLIKVDVRTR